MNALFARRSLIFALVGIVIVSAALFAFGHRSATMRGIIQNSPIVQTLGAVRMAKTLAAEAVADGLMQDSNRYAAGAPAPNAASLAMTVPQGRMIPPPPKGSRGPSQLIRTATISLEVSDVSKALRDATLIADEQLGDVIGLNDTTPSSTDEPHTATMAIRVPEYRFEQTLDAFGRLGKVTTKSVSAQDVSDQLVDAQARLRNLRRTESDMLGIMDRSGNIDQVLNVTQQISSVREQIERLDAQIQSMQYQVSYSTVNITFTTPMVVTTPTGWALLSVAWKNATSAARDFAVSLVSLALWVAAFSPYALIVVGFGWFLARRLRAISPSAKPSA